MQKKEILLNACISMMKLFVILLAVAMSTNYMNIRKYLSLQNSANWLEKMLVVLSDYIKQILLKRDLPLVLSFVSMSRLINIRKYR